MYYALIIAGVIESTGGLPPSAKRLDTGEWVMPPAQQWTPAQAESCGYFPVVEVARPPNTESVTYTKTVELVAGDPTEVWSPRPWTDDELAAQQTAALRIEFDVAQSQLTPDQTNALLAADAPPYGDPWVQPAGAHDAYPLGAVVTHQAPAPVIVNAGPPTQYAQAVWESLLTANVHEPGVSGWREIGEEWPQWVQPAGAHDSYPLGAQVTHNGTHWVSIHDGANSWEPGVYGWDPA